MYRILYLFAMLVFIASCQNNTRDILIIESAHHITTIPSASGIEVIEDKVWTVGDDSPFLYQLNMDLNILDTFRISSIQKKEGNRILKTDKADFESLGLLGNQLYILGSGSKAVWRDTLFIFNIENKSLLQKQNIRPLYDKFLDLGGFDSIQQINIEGMIASENGFYFFNRGNICGHNDIYHIHKEDLLTFFNLGELPDVHLSRYQLPKIDSYLSGFSGACLSNDGKYFYFTSSVEATQDVYHDGEVLGSFIGKIKLENNEIEYWPVKQNGKFLKTKIESISILQSEEDFIRFVCTSDNDDGTSYFYFIKLNIKT